MEGWVHEVPTHLKDKGARVLTDSNAANSPHSTETKLEASVVLQPRLFAGARERSGRWLVAALEADYTGLGQLRSAGARHQRKDRRVDSPSGDRRITIRRQAFA